MPSFITARIEELQQLAVKWALQPPSYDRTMFGFWLHDQLADLWETGLLKESDLVDFNATVKILIDQILPKPHDGDDE